MHLYHRLEPDLGHISCRQEVDSGAGYALRWSKGLSAKVEYADFKEDDVLAGAARKPDTRKSG